MKRLMMILALAATGVSATAHAAVVQVPEPGSLGLLAAGVVGLVVAARIRRRK